MVVRDIKKFHVYMNYCLFFNFITHNLLLATMVMMVNVIFRNWHYRSPAI
jgi:hypothetical protein